MQLGELEQLVLLAVVRLEGEGYGTTLRAEIEGVPDETWRWERSTQRWSGWVVGQAMVPVIVGAGLGLLAIWCLRGLLTRIAFRVEGLETWTLVTATSILLSAALAASWLPAWRASQIDPVEALRAE